MKEEKEIGELTLGELCDAIDIVKVASQDARTRRVVIDSLSEAYPALRMDIGAKLTIDYHRGGDIVIETMTDREKLKYFKSLDDLEFFIKVQHGLMQREIESRKSGGAA